MSEKVELKEKIAAVDQNIRELWDAMDDDQRKSLKGELFILNRYISSAKTGNKEIQQHFVLAVNEYFNKNWNNLQKEHSKLLWMLLCMCSWDGKTTFFHEWIGPKKLGSNTSNKRAKILEELYPSMKYDEIELLANLSSDKEIKQLAKDHGWEDSAIAKILK
jgi:hypothetical protein